MASAEDALTVDGELVFDDYNSEDHVDSITEARILAWMGVDEPQVPGCTLSAVQAERATTLWKYIRLVWEGNGASEESGLRSWLRYLSGKTSPEDSLAWWENLVLVWIHAGHILSDNSFSVSGHIVTTEDLTRPALVADFEAATHALRRTLYNICFDVLASPSRVTMSHASIMFTQYPLDYVKVVYRAAKEVGVAAQRGGRKEAAGGVDDSENALASMCSYCSGTKSDMASCRDCDSAYYCGKTCRKAHWKQHRKTCRSVKHPTEKDGLGRRQPVLFGFVSRILKI